MAANMNLPERVKQKLRELPDRPGCYLMRDRRGEIIYVGKAVSLRRRVQSYFRLGTLRHADPKLRGLIRSVADLEIIAARTEAEAILTEGQLIKDYRPRYNVDFRDDKRFLLLRVDRRQPFPWFELCRIRREDGREYYGPYASAASARAALDFIEKRFGVRKCRMRVPMPADHDRCICDIVRFCSAPCVKRESPEGYARRVEEACAFLRGERPALLEEIGAAMNQAAEVLDFERAAALRDTLTRLRAATENRARVLSSPQMRADRAREGCAGLGAVLGMPAPRVIEAYDVSHISGTFSVGSRVCAVDGQPHRNRYRHFRIRTVAGIDDPAMMGEIVTRAFDHRADGSEPLPDLVLVDGGPTQVQSARNALSALGLDRVPVAGLAKRYEELYWKGRTPLRLPLESAALQVLQRIRDEAHRFAHTYNQALRRRQLRESILDEIDGVGPDRKRRLLERFGSARQLARAPESEIAAVPGVGPILARKVKQAVGD